MNKFFILFSIILGLLAAPPAAAAAGDGGRYTLEQAVRRALEQNFAIKASESGLRASESGRLAARGEFGPKLATSYGYTDYQHDEDLYRWRVSLTQDIFSGFATLAAYERAVLQKESAAAALARARLALILTVQQNFFAYLKAKADVRSASDSYGRLAAQLKETRSFYDVGLRPRLDVLQAEVNASEAQDVLIRARNSVETQRARLNTLLNIPLGAKAEYVGELAHIPFMAELDDCLARAYRQRPDISIARQAVSMAERDKTSAASNFYPNIKGELAWATQGETWTADGSPERPRGYSEWSLGLSGSINLFEWGKSYYEVEKSAHGITRLRMEEAELRQEVAFQVQARLIDLDNAAKRIAVARKSVEQSREAYQAALARYREQVGTSLDVLDAQSRLTSSEVSLSGARADYLSALAALYAAIGEENSNLRQDG
ncbi:MAG: TolC family protein [Deltaproteobacteria bacterium]|jgi:outer membrane protein|nr:TolC family protein [Deltaproteobacteria bacterium]